MCAYIRANNYAQTTVTGLVRTSARQFQNIFELEKHILYLIKKNINTRGRCLATCQAEIRIAIDFHSL